MHCNVGVLAVRGAAGYNSNVLDGTNIRFPGKRQDNNFDMMLFDIEHPIRTHLKTLDTGCFSFHRN